MANDPLCELSDVKEWLGVKPTEENQDDALDWLIQACSAQIAQFCGRDNLGSVGSYVENYRPRLASNRPRMMLKHYPVVALTKVFANSVSLPIMTSAQLQTGIPGTTPGGVFLEDDNRTLSFLNFCFGGGYIQVTYTAGYDMLTNTTPFGLRQAAIQFVGEVYKSSNWIGYRSKSLAGETTSFEGGVAWAMSPRTKAMLQPYVNRMPPYL